MLKFLVFLVLFSTEQARPLTDENETLAEAIEQLYEKTMATKTKKVLETMEKEAELYSVLAAIAKRQDLQEEVAQETQRLVRMGQLLHEEVDGSSLAQKRRMVGSNHLVEGLVSPVDADEEALQNYIEQFHKTFRGDPDEYTRHRGSERIEPYTLETKGDSNNVERDDLT